MSNWIQYVSHSVVGTVLVKVELERSMIASQPHTFGMKTALNHCQSDSPVLISHLDH